MNGQTEYFSNPLSWVLGTSFTFLFLLIVILVVVYLAIKYYHRDEVNLSDVSGQGEENLFEQDDGGCCDIVDIKEDEYEDY